MKYTTKQVVGAGACDPSGRLSMLGALVLVEDAVTVTMAKMHIDGITVRKNYGAIMVFAKNHLQFFGDINWRDEITVSCFVADKSAVRMHLDVCVKKGGAIAMYARTEVCAVDEQTARIRRLDTVGVGAQVRVTRAPMELVWAPLDGEGGLLDTVAVQTSNIDYAGHTNNVEYIRLLLNTFTLDEWRGIAPRELQVAYLNQSFLGDRLAIHGRDTQIDAANGVTHERLYTVKKGEQAVLRCAIRW